jgi:hypothetical protein
MSRLPVSLEGKAIVLGALISQGRTFSVPASKYLLIVLGRLY